MSIKRAAAAVALALLALVAVNAFDEELTPEARALFTRKTVTFARDSGWALIAGFHAPAGEDPRAFAGSPRRAGERPLEIRAPDELLCVPQDMDCVRAFAARPEFVRGMVADNAILVARYRELLGATGLADVVEALDYYRGASPHFSTILRAQQVTLSEAGIDAAGGRNGEAIAWLEKDAAFHRRWLAQAGSILTKMLALRALSRDFLVAAQVARHSRDSLSAAEWAALDRVVAPLGMAERGVAPVQQVEAALTAKVLDELRADSRTTSGIIEAPRFMAAVAAATLKRNATLNFAQPLFSAWTTLDAVPSDELAGAIQRIAERAQHHVEPDWRWAYNYTGRRFIAQGTPDFSDYVYRLRDLDALAATMRCAIAMNRDRVAADTALAYVAASPMCVDPYERRGLAWNVEHGELSFRPRSAGQVKRFGGRGDRVAFAVFAQR